MKNFKLNDSVSVDMLKFVSTMTLLQASTGGGKSWAIRRILEQTFGKVPHIILDTEGEFATLREKFDYILIGKGYDIAADPKTAAIMALRLWEEGVSAIIDLYELSPWDRQAFVKNFVDAMINAPKKLWNPVLLVIDEAHEYAPEGDRTESGRAIHLLASKGRKRRIGTIFATQRIATLSKNVVAACKNKLIGYTSLLNDMKRANDELGFGGKELLLRQLDPGDFYAFGPAISKDIIKFKIGKVETTHGNDAATVGKVAPASEKVKRALAKLADLPQVAAEEANTITALKKENSELKRQKNINPKEYDRKLIPLNKEISDLKSLLSKIKKMIPGFADESQKIIEPIQKKVSIDTNSIGKGEIAILKAAAQFDGITREHLTILTGYKRSSRDAYIQRLQAKGYIRVALGSLHATEEGFLVLGSDYEPLPTGLELQEHLMQTLPEGEKNILSLLINAYPESVSRETISNETNYQRSSRDAYIQRLNARRLINIEKDGITASEKLF